MRCFDGKEWSTKFEDSLPPFAVRATEYRLPCGVRYDLLDAGILEAMAQIMAAGCKKYGPDNWRKGLTGENSGINHALKHIMEYQAKKPNDYGACRMHLAQAAVNLMFEFYFDKKDENPDEKV